MSSRALSQTVFNAWAAQKCSECGYLRPYCVCKPVSNDRSET